MEHVLQQIQKSFKCHPETLVSTFNLLNQGKLPANVRV